MLNKKEVIEAIAKQTGYTRYSVRKVLDSFIDVIFEGVKSDQRIRVGGLGVFFPKFQDSRPVRNPQTMEPCMLAPKYTMKFRAAEDLVRKLNEPESGDDKKTE